MNKYLTPDGVCIHPQKFPGESSNFPSKIKDNIEFLLTLSPENLVQYFVTNIGERKSEFDIHTTMSDEFDVFSHGKIQGLELAIMRGASEVHYHEKQDVYFCFSDDAIITIGKPGDVIGESVASSLVKKGQVIHIPTNTLHAASPKEGDKEVYLLIFNSQGEERERRGGYPVDTFFPKNR